MSKRKDKNIPLVACFFIGSPLAFVLPGLLLLAGVPAAAGIAIGQVVGTLVGYAVLNNL